MNLGRDRKDRLRLPVVFTVVAVVAGVAVAVSGAASPVPGLSFAPGGNWVYNSVLRAAFHVDGGTGNVDAQVPFDAPRGTQVVYGETGGHIISDEIHRFDPGNRGEIETTMERPAPEEPSAVEAAGGPYLVFRDSGVITRLGENSVNLPLGGPLSEPVVTPDGTLWVHKTGQGELCKLMRDADKETCVAGTSAADAGALTTVDGEPMFLNFTTDTLHTVGDNGLGESVTISTALPDDARLAAADVDGRIPAFNPRTSELHLVDPVGAAEPVTIDLPAGDYSRPASTGDVVGLLNHKTEKLLVYDVKGRKVADERVPAESGEPRLVTGEDKRIYVEGGQGRNVVIVDHDGKTNPVSVKGVTAPTTTAPIPTDTPVDEPADAPEDPPRERPDRDDDRPVDRPGDGPRDPNPGGNRPETQTPRPPPVTPAPLPASPPGAPPNVRATAGNASATVTWGAPNANRSRITGYRISWSGDSRTVGAGQRSANISGLRNGTRYQFTVAALSSAGIGASARSNPVTPVAPVSPADAPGNLQFGYDESDRPTRDVTLTWSRPAMNGGTFVHYLVTATGMTNQTVTGETAATFSQMDAYTTATFTVHAVTRTASGDRLTGDAVSGTIPAAPEPTVTVRRGADTTYNGCSAPNCQFLHITMTNFPPNHRYSVVPHATEPDEETNPGYSGTIEADGTEIVDDRFPNDYVGSGNIYRWVVVTDLETGETFESNPVHWEDLG